MLLAASRTVASGADAKEDTNIAQITLDGDYPITKEFLMSRVFKQLNSFNQLCHSSQRSPLHHRDKQEGDARNAETWLLIPHKETGGGERDFTKVPGRDFIIENGGAKAVESDIFISYLVKEKQLRLKYRGLKTRGQRATETLLKCQSPLLELTISCSPWGADFLAAGADKAPNRVATSVETLAAKMVPEVERQTGCQVIGFTVHFDTSDPHVNFILARVRPDRSGVMRHNGIRGLKLTGPWLCGVDRQRRVGIAYEPHDTKYDRAFARFFTRYPNTPLPVDIHLTRVFDCLFEAMFGVLLPFKDCYRDRVESSRKRALNDRKTLLLEELRHLDQTVGGINELKKEIHHGKN